MTEIMVHSAVGENFSFSESKFNSIESENKSQLVIGDNSELDENTVIFNDKMDSDKSSESTICGSNSKDSVVSDDIQDSSSRTIKSSNIFREGFKYMATETTVINATYNVIAQSSVPCVKEIPKIVNQQQPTSTVTSNKDESRVIVQILTDAKKSVKSPDAIKNKSTHIENQSTHSFRDDVFKILSKSRSSKIDIGNTSKEEIEISNTLKVSERFQSVSSQMKESTQIERNRRKRSLKSYFLFGGGPKIGDIEHVSACLNTATPNALRIVHYVMYDKYGLCSSQMQIVQTKKNILRFCGYPFDQNSQEYAKRINCLKKIPRPILYEVHQAIFGESSLTSRTLMVQQLMEFFSKPKRYQKIVGKMKQNMQFMLEEEYNNLKETALRGPLPSVCLEKLEMDDVEKIKNKFKMGLKQDTIKAENAVQKTEAADKPNLSLAAFIFKGPGKKLKYFPAILRNVEAASEKQASLLHLILYGRIETEPVVCKRSILEFSGFLEYQTDFIAQRKATLNKLDQTDLFELCQILCLRGKTISRIRKIEKIMEYLQSPFNPRIRSIRRNQKLFRETSSLSKCTSKPRSVNYSQFPILNDPEEVVGDGGLRLRDFKKICSNIECSAPSDLTELNDLLFIKPCDETEIHEKILNFTRFGFTDTSTQYHYRKTLMFYMGPCIVRKIAKLLDIEYWDNQVRSHEDLSSSILNFLMEKKSQYSFQARLPLSPFPVSSFNNSCNETPKVQQHFQSAAFQHEANKSITCHKESVYIHRLSKSSNDLSSSADNALVPVNMDERNDVVSPTNNFAEDDSIPLRVFIHHPTDLELKQVIHSIIKDDLWHITLGNLVQKVYQNYPSFNLSYRENFIKAEARQMLSELRSDAFNVVQHMSFNHLPM